MSFLNFIKRVFPVFFISISTIFLCDAQDASEIILLDFKDTSILNISREKGYDNQPFFNTLDEELYFTGIHENNQADIYCYFLLQKLKKRLTTTSPEAEYSPTPYRKNTISVVRVEKDSAQKLWQFSLPHKSFSPLARLTDSIGYNAWFNDTIFAYFKLGKTFTLHTADIKRGHQAMIANNIGRCIKKRPNSAEILYEVKEGDFFVIYSVDLKWKTKKLYQLPEGVEFFDVDEKGNLIYIFEEQLWRSKKGGKPKLWANLSRFKFKGISRLAVSNSGRYVALVEKE